ncbi:hypothetical protein, partial [Rubritalea halochordaticola]|uniref:hypothetical protein n=1 Tax=Rubritalea halochordaticola TaxID=714537 RepID=UPI0031FDF77C
RAPRLAGRGAIYIFPGPGQHLSAPFFELFPNPLHNPLKTHTFSPEVFSTFLPNKPLRDHFSRSIFANSSLKPTKIAPNLFDVCL